jgi:hypothetical protein
MDWFLCSWQFNFKNGLLLKEPFVRFIYVDESGDPVVFSKAGKVLVGRSGCPRFFILGKLGVEDPVSLGTELDSLRHDFLNDPYFKDVPSMQLENRKTALGFHAKDDLPEIRREVFRVLKKHECRFYAVVRDKMDVLAYVKHRREKEVSYRYRQNELYDTLVSELFQQFHGSMSDDMVITFARRGSKPRQTALLSALEKAERVFEGAFGFRRDRKVSVDSSTPQKCPGLQAADYFLWALQRFYERGEDRYISFIWDRVGGINDLDVIDGQTKGKLFRKDMRLNITSRPIK